jgi:hypothetical protein
MADKMRWAWRIAWIGFLVYFVLGPIHGVYRVALILVFVVLLAVELGYGLARRRHHGLEKP